MTPPDPATPSPLEALLKEVEALDAATVDADFARYGRIMETAEAPGDDNGMDAAAAIAAHADSVVRIRARAATLFGPDGFSVEDGYDWQPRWAGGKPRGLENQPPKVYRRQVFAVPVTSSALPAAPRLAAIVRVLMDSMDAISQADVMFSEPMSAAVAKLALRRADEIAGGGA